MNKNYNKLIKEAQEANHSRDAQYLENHHILPRSLGGNDTPDNMVLLTAYEHFMAHYELFKSYDESQWQHEPMMRALLMMGCISPDHADRYVEAEKYQEAREAYAEFMRGDGNPMKNPESRQKVSETIKGSRMMFNPKSGIVKQIMKNNIQLFLKTGWEFGMPGHSEKVSGVNNGMHSNNRNTVWVCDGKSEKNIEDSELRKYIQLGWVHGRLKSPKQSKSKMAKNNPMYGKSPSKKHSKSLSSAARGKKNMYNPKDYTQTGRFIDNEIEEKLSMGWEFGFVTKKMLGAEAPK